MFMRTIALLTVSTVGLLAVGCTPESEQESSTSDLTVESNHLIAVDKTVESACGLEHGLDRVPAARQRLAGEAKNQPLAPNRIADLGAKADVVGMKEAAKLETLEGRIPAHEIADRDQSPQARIGMLERTEALLGREAIVKASVEATEGGFAFKADAEKLGCDGGRIEAKMLGDRMIGVTLHRSEAGACRCGVGLHGAIKGLEANKSYTVIISSDRESGEGTDLVTVKTIVPR
jgi:hypothetical protein